MAEDVAASPLPTDADHHDNGRFLHDLAAVNTNIARYLFRHMDADSGRGKPLGVEDERRLATS